MYLYPLTIFSFDVNFMHFLDASRNYFQLSIHFNIKCPWRRGSDLTCQLHGHIFIIFSERETIFSFLSRAATFSLSSSNCNKSFRRAKNVTFLSSSQIKILFFSLTPTVALFSSLNPPQIPGETEKRKRQNRLNCTSFIPQRSIGALILSTVIEPITRPA